MQEKVFCCFKTPIYEKLIVVTLSLRAEGVKLKMHDVTNLAGFFKASLNDGRFIQIFSHLL